MLKSSFLFLLKFCIFIFVIVERILESIKIPCIRTSNLSDIFDVGLYLLMKSTRKDDSKFIENVIVSSATWQLQKKQYEVLFKKGVSLNEEILKWQQKWLKQW